MERGVVEGRGDAEVEVVVGILMNEDGVFEELADLGGREPESATGVGGVADVHTFAGAEVNTDLRTVGWIGVVIRDSFPAVVEVLDFDLRRAIGGDVDWSGSGEWALRGRRDNQSVARVHAIGPYLNLIIIS